MRKLICITLAVFVSACSSSGDGGDAGFTLDSCSNSDQKRFVRDVMRDWYLWNDLLPANISIGDFDSPEELLAFLTTFSPDDGSGQPVDRFSFITTAAADAAFLGEGQFEGFGFISRFIAADDLRLAVVYADGPAGMGGLARGQRILELNGRTIAEIQAAEGVNAVFDTSPVDFTLREPDGNEFTVSIAQGVVTIDPVPLLRIIDAGGGRNVGYFRLAQFISTAEPEFDTIFSALIAAGVNDLIIDLRYNGGGLVSTTEELADYLGGDIAENLTFSETRFNADKAASNNRTAFFSRLGNSLSLSRLAVISNSGSASASEMIPNGMDPHVDVVYVGSATSGKPVGQIGLEFCEKVIRPTAFQLFNADGFGDYFDGLGPDCPAADDLNIPMGDDTDPNVIAALSYFDTGSCPVVLAPPGISKPRVATEIPQLDRRGSPERVYADAF